MIENMKHLDWMEDNSESDQASECTSTNDYSEIKCDIGTVTS